MIRTLLVALIILASCTYADAALPWKNLSELERDVTDTQTGICGPDQYVSKMQTTKDGVTYIILGAPDSRRFVIAEMENDRPKTLYIGKVDKEGKLVVNLVRPFNPPDNPCPILYPTEVKG